jgi:threonine/homoserine/homoserine lactone efflux protein
MIKRLFKALVCYTAMNLADFGVQVIAISASGVLTPGPLFLANMLYGSSQGVRSGIKLAYGHTVVELPLIILLSTGLFSIAALSRYEKIIGLVGGIGMICFASIQIIGIVKKKRGTNAIAPDNKSNPFITGIAFSALNPFFLAWWLTAGLKMIADSTTFGFAAGITILFGFHIWMDYAWLGTTAYISSKGSIVLESRYYPILLLGLAVVLVYYGIIFIHEAIV